MTIGSPWLPSRADPLFVLAMDHRASFSRDLFGITGEPTAVDLARMRSAKELIYRGLRLVLDRHDGIGRLGVLVDEDFGADVVSQAKQDGIILAMPIERSGVRVFTLEYGDRFVEHVERFSPDFSKVLVRYNPADDMETRLTQISRLAAVSAWAEQSAQRWLFELLVTPTAQQLDEYGDQDGYDRAARATLTAQVITELQAGGVHPSIWKLEGYETADDAKLVLAAVAADREHPAGCIVLGRDAPQDRLEHWLSIAGALEGYVGFAVGRSIWERPLRGYLAGRCSSEQLTEAVSSTYQALMATYTQASGSHTVP